MGRGGRTKKCIIYCEIEKMGEQGVHPLGCPGRPTRPCTRPVHVPGGPLAKARVPGSPTGLLVAAAAPACCSTIPAKAGIAAREDVFWGTSNLLTARNDDIATLWGGASAETGTAKSWQRPGGAQVAVGGREMTVAKSKKVAATSFCGRGSSKSGRRCSSIMSWPQGGR